MQRIYQRNEKLYLLFRAKPAKPNVIRNVSFTGFRSSSLHVKLITEARPFRILVLIVIVVLSLHACAWLCLQRQAQPTKREPPLVMEAAIIPVSISKPRLLPPPPPPPTAETKRHKKVPHKLKIKAAAPSNPEPSEFAQISQVYEIASLTSLKPDSSAISNENESPTKNVEHMTEATIDTHYVDNPKPAYPAVALRQGWQGQVMLRVQVNEEGVSDAVTIERSSGYELLDESALEAVKQWRFNPAKRGDIAIASSVIVPIVFMIDDQNQA